MPWVRKVVKAMVGAAERRAGTEYEWHILRKMKLRAWRHRFFDDLRKMLVFKVGNDISSLFKTFIFFLFKATI